MEITIEIVNNEFAILRLSGKLNMVYAGQLREEIADLIAKGYFKIAIDMGQVDFMDSSGLGALIYGLKATREAGGDLRIAAPVEQVQLVLKLTNLDRVVNTYSSAETAFQE